MSAATQNFTDQRDVMTFCYWDRPDTGLIADFLSHWRYHFPGFEVFGDAAAEIALAEAAPDDVELYRSIRLPAARADVARLALLYRHGGLYVDCHCRVGDTLGLAGMLRALDRMDLFVLEVGKMDANARMHFPRLLHNCFLLCRPRLPLVRRLLMRGLENLRARREAETAKGGHVPYNLFNLVGPQVVTAEILDLERDPPGLHPELQGAVRVIHEADAPVKPHSFARQYNGASNEHHWTARQTTEPLFHA